LARRLAEEGGLDWEALEPTWLKSRGCARCAETGYHGRVPIAETLVVSEAVGEALRRRAGTDELRRVAVAAGMTTMAADGVRRAARGETSLEEVLRAAPRRRE
jgi:type II secretory ATPase GspE/PulE/Tfp pilus assembly ATPase PilB-like protein